MDENTRWARWAPWARPAAVGAAGLLAGGLLAGTLTASAEDSTGTDGGSGSAGTAAPAGPGNLDPSQPQRTDEELLTGSVAGKVEAAALVKYPRATVERTETDSDGVYEAHLVTASGSRLTVEVGKDFTVTGTEAHGGVWGGPGGGPGAPGASVEQGATAASWST